MSTDQEELNLNELVGNLLAAHNEHDVPSQLDNSQAELPEEIPELPEESQTHGELEDEDLAAVVAQAIGGMEDHGSEEPGPFEAVQHDGEGSQSGATQEGPERTITKEEEWAQILQQGLLQESQLNPQEHIDDSMNMAGTENLDHDDEALRRAILESLQNLNVAESQPLPGKEPGESKGSHKKKEKGSSRKDKTKDKKTKKTDSKKDDKVSSSKKKSAKKKKDSSKKTSKDLPKHSISGTKAPKPSSDNDLLNFEDVIKGFMEQASNDAALQPKNNLPDESSVSGISDGIDAETRSLVENTLRAFESELLAGPTVTSKKPTSRSKNKTQFAKAKSNERRSYEGVQPIVQTLPLSKPKKIKPTDHSKKKKAAKKSSKEKDEYNEVDFSKALADMVNQVVNTTLSDQEPAVPAVPAAPTSSAGEARPELPNKTSVVSTGIPPAIDNNAALENDSAAVDGKSQKPIAKHQSQGLEALEHHGFDHLRPQKSIEDQPHPQREEARLDSRRASLEDSTEGPLLSFPDAKLITTTSDTSAAGDGFDLNQIMQNAMTMAFQGQVGQQISQSDLNDFNQQLQGYSVSSFLDGVRTSAKSKKKPSKKKNIGDKKTKTKSLKNKNSWDQDGLGSLMPAPGGGVMNFKDFKIKPTKLKAPKVDSSGVKSKKSKNTNKKTISSQELSAALHATAGSLPDLIQDLPKALDLQEIKKSGRPRKTPTTVPISDKFWRKRYKIAVTEAAARARRQRMDRNKANRKKLKEDRHARRQERHLKREEDRLNEENERKELEMIVARGPPYPLDLRLTKKGTPKKPYRRYTADEMKTRLSTMSAKFATARDIQARGLGVQRTKAHQFSVPRKVPIIDFTNSERSLKSDAHSNTFQKLGLYPPLIKIQSIDEKYAPEFPQRPGDPFITDQAAREEHMVRPKKKKHSSRYESLRSPKTVVHREKVVFHPPWSIPQFPPLALPVARRKKRSKLRTIEGSKNSKSSRRDGGKISAPSFVSGNKIIPSSLFPIINTLKAAARAKAAAGATPEEAGKHLGAMLRNARLTIAQVLARARSQGMRNYGSIKTLDDVKQLQTGSDQPKIKRTPIFSLSSIKAIKEQNQSTATPDTVRTSESSRPPHESKNPSLENIPSAVVAGDNPSEDKSSNQVLSSPSAEERLKGLVSSETTNVPSERVVDKTGIDDGPSSEGQYPEAGNNSDQKSDQVQTNSEISQNQASPDKVQDNDAHLKVSKPVQVVKLEDKGVEPMLAGASEFKQNDAQRIGNDLPPEVKVELARAINDIMNPREKARKKYTRRTTPVLNLEGLVPPASSISRIKPDRVLETSRENHFLSDSATSRSSTPLSSVKEKSQTRARTPVNKLGGPSKPAFDTKWQFTIPTENIKGQPLPLISILKRAKKYLNSEELTQLRKAMTNERKRKWREANASKNKDHDLRARLRKRANALFGTTDSALKNDWFNKEYLKRSLKKEPENGDETKQSIQELPTSITDHEVLSMIASLLGKEDVSRAIEKEIIDEANMVGPDRKAGRKKVKTAFTTTKLEQSSLQTPGPSSLNDAEKSEEKPRDHPAISGSKSESLSNSQGDQQKGTTQSSGESIDPIFSQITKRSRLDELACASDNSKRVKTGTHVESEPLKRPAYINLENTG
ncbi:LAME_0H11122g1_1 [Lachancea meyersii CBS 8951]|uniref:LAME_0H11122g1_1 n=1 Tax=Lachancea meyersii CBS 8951 TaxID=1266667 RepID=A0A1G4KGI5_9SACH|nr:LAME_0H11122g1_1 [Lachancea meyersii CBS 8951]